MRAFLIGIGLVMGVALIGVPQAVAQSRTTPGCGDDRGVDRCSADVHRRVLDLYGLQPIEGHARAGDEVRRAFYVDGYGRDMVAIMFVRAPGRDPILSVHFPRDGDVIVPPATAPVPAAIWAEVLVGSRYFDRALAPLPANTDPNVISICLHSWVYTVEATQPSGREGEDMRVRRKAEDACADGLAADYAGQLQSLALPLLPYCAALDPDQHRNGASILNACRLLSGDRLAAADGFNLLGTIRSIEAGDRRAVVNAFAQQATIDWAGVQTSGGLNRVPDAWLLGSTDGGRANLHISRVVGERVDRVSAEGEVSRYVDGPNDTRILMVAPATFELRDRGDGLGLRITRATVGAFADRSRD